MNYLAVIFTCLTLFICVEWSNQGGTKRVKYDPDTEVCRFCSNGVLTSIPVNQKILMNDCSTASCSWTDEPTKQMAVYIENNIKKIGNLDAECWIDNKEDMKWPTCAQPNVFCPEGFEAHYRAYV